MNRVKPIKTKSDYRAALKQIDQLLAKDPQEGSLEFDELDVIGTLVADYERKNFVIALPDPVEAVKIAMEEKGMKAKDLVPCFGSKGVVSEFLNRKRTPSLNAIRGLHKELDIPYEVLIAEYEINPQKS